MGLQRLRLWLLPLAGVVVYPMAIASFSRAITAYREIGELSIAAAAAVLMLLVAASVPAAAARALILIHPDDLTNLVLTRSLLYLMFAVSPLHVLSVLLAAKTGMVQHHGAIWVSTWAMTGLVLYLGKKRNTSTAPGSAIVWLRIIHGTASLCLLLGFLVAHLINHELAIWSVKLHGSAMESLRLWYRADYVEPALFMLLLVMIATGAPLAANHSRGRTDAFRIVQMATGVYVAVFLCAHILAVLGARSVGVETDWFFATGPDGLLDGRGMLIPYYIFAVFFVTLHIGCGLRLVLLKHGVADVTANKTFYVVAAAGLVVTASIAIAALGFHIHA
jgi:succinate dehydrogenase/fumarate reductase cytochrome b subunit